MGFEITRRMWEKFGERVSRLERKIHRLENKLELMEKRMKPSELYRVVKQQEHEESIATEMPHIKPGF